MIQVLWVNYLWIRPDADYVILMHTIINLTPKKSGTAYLIRASIAFDDENIASLESPPI
jgi:hypothetical protein